ncbi:LacI family transcriptional regulator [Burkholderia sp. WAC0059]|uniref:LacI family DNA-binding transcriptional regulator n=1 Tax=Burkholderia sp. WAC0059 TaxID=2066022 RepID=UPI000C7F52F1|nr:LacI family DNA-binding transcriptional regulator [Burkholderia sp. WAC0059]PLZ02870.1 LacI family transcriptional regulator [Burkholderia sp. WAC0059]
MKPRRDGERAASVTSHDVAKVAGVSQSTVSRVLRDDPRVSGEARERVLRALAQTGYTVNAAARAFRTNRTGAIGVVVARLSNPVYPALLELIGARLTGLNQRMTVWNAEHGGDLQASQAIRQGAVDGVILTATTAESAFVREVASSRVPVVLVNRTVENYPADQVSSDNLDGGRRAAEYLVKCGRRRIALIGGTQQASTIRERERGFRAALAEAGIELRPSWYQPTQSFSHASGHEAVSRLLELASPPDAVFCVNDVLALGAIDGARSAGMRVPSDLWVIGYDDIEPASWDAYDLTTVRQPLGEMVASAIDLLLARIADPARALESRCFRNELVIRRSTAREPWPRPDNANDDDGR